MLTRLERQQPLLWNLILVGLLPCIAGAVNASGLFIVGRYTSHITGSVGRVGDELAQGNLALAESFAWVVGAFFAGAMVCAALLKLAQAFWHARFAAPLTAEAIALLAVTVIGLVHGPQANMEDTFSICLLSFAMGMQNAMVTSLSGTRVRTTHMTGVVTDLGLDTVHVILRSKNELAQVRQNGFWVALKRIASDQDLTRFWIHLGIFASFVVGAVIGPYAYLRLGMASMLLPVCALLLLAVIDSLPVALLDRALGRNADSRPQQPSAPPTQG